MASSLDRPLFEPRERPQFRPVANPINTVATILRFNEGPRPVAPVKPLQPEHPDLPRPPEQSVPIAPPPRGPNDLMKVNEALSQLNPRIQSHLNQYLQDTEEMDGLEASTRAIQENASDWADAVRLDPTLADKSPYFRRV